MAKFVNGISLQNICRVSKFVFKLVKMQNESSKAQSNVKINTQTQVWSFTMTQFIKKSKDKLIPCFYSTINPMNSLEHLFLCFYPSDKAFSSSFKLRQSSLSLHEMLNIFIQYLHYFIYLILHITDIWLVRKRENVAKM